METASRPATIEDLDEPAPVLILSKFRGKDGAPLTFAVREMTIEQVRAVRARLNEAGNAADGDELAVQRLFVGMCVVEPALDEARLLAMQKRGIPWGHLVEQVNRLNGLS